MTLSLFSIMAIACDIHISPARCRLLSSIVGWFIACQSFPEPGVVALLAFLLPSFPSPRRSPRSTPRRRNYWRSRLGASELSPHVDLMRISTPPPPAQRGGETSEFVFQSPSDGGAAAYVSSAIPPLPGSSDHSAGPALSGASPGLPTINGVFSMSAGAVCGVCFADMVRCSCPRHQQVSSSPAAGAPSVSAAARASVAAGAVDHVNAGRLGLGPAVTPTSAAAPRPPPVGFVPGQRRRNFSRERSRDAARRLHCPVTSCPCADQARHRGWVSDD
jgi:hypothetical protein